MNKRLYLDLDGVMADFDSLFPRLFNVDHRGLADAEMWRHINAHPTYWLDMPLFDGALEFLKEIEHLSPIILTACPKSNYENAARQKREWCRRHFGSGITVLPVAGGSAKPLFMHAPGDVLVDDFIKNIDAWEAASGTGIHHLSFEATLKAIADEWRWSHKAVPA